MKFKLVLDIFMCLMLLLWPVFLFVSIMILASPAGADSGKSIFVSILFIFYPAILFIIYSLFYSKFFVVPSLIPLIIVSLISIVLFKVLGHFNVTTNYMKGIKNFGYVVTKDAVYYQGKSIDGVDVESFEEIFISGDKFPKGHYTKDKYSAYYKGKKIEGAKPENFQLIKRDGSPGPEAFDGDQYYSYGRVVEYEDKKAD